MDLIIEFVVWIFKALTGTDGGAKSAPSSSDGSNTAQGSKRGPYNYGDGRSSPKTLEEILEEVRLQRQGAPPSKPVQPPVQAQAPRPQPPPRARVFPTQGEVGPGAETREAFHSRPDEIAKRREGFAAQGAQTTMRREEFADQTGAAQAAKRAAQRQVKAPRQTRTARAGMEQPGELSSVGERQLSSLEDRKLTTNLKQEEIVKPREIEKRFTELDRREDTKFKPADLTSSAPAPEQSVASSYIDLFNALRTAPKNTRIEMARRAFVFNVVFGPCKAKTASTFHSKTKSVTQSRAEEKD